MRLDATQSLDPQSEAFARCPQLQVKGLVFEAHIQVLLAASHDGSQTQRLGHVPIGQGIAGQQAGDTM